MKEIIATGASVMEAVENGREQLAQLGVDATLAEYEVLEEAKNGFLFRKPAKVRVYVEDSAADDALTEEDEEDDFDSVVFEENESSDETDDEEEVDDDVVDDEDDEIDDEEADEENDDLFDESVEPAGVSEESVAQQEKTSEPEDYLAATDAAVRYLSEILTRMGVRDLIVTAESDGERTILNINGNDDDLGVVIGHRGDTLTALQYLVSLAANNCCKGYFKVSLNVKNFREKRERTLETVASKTAYKATKLQKNIALEPMSPYERSIIHTAVQAIDGVTSWSVGENEKRHVVIGPIGLDEGGEGMPVKYAKVGGNRNGRGGYHRGSGYGRSGYSNRGSRGGYNNNNRGGYRKNYRDSGYRDDRVYRENRSYRDDHRDGYSNNRYNEERPTTRTKSNYETGFTYGKINLNSDNEE